MINLMPPAHKEAIFYARRNSFLIRWLVGILVVITGIGVITVGGLFYIKQDISSYDDSIASIQKDLDAQDEAETLKQVSEFSNNFSLLVNVLSREVLFSKLLQHFGTLMPRGTVLEDLTLSSGFTGGLDLTIGATDYESASQALVNLQASESLLFEKADANSIKCEGRDDRAPYLCGATIRVLLAGNNPFLLLNQEKQ